MRRIHRKAIRLSIVDAEMLLRQRYSAKEINLNLSYQGFDRTVINNLQAIILPDPSQSYSAQHESA